MEALMVIRDLPCFRQADSVPVSVRNTDIDDIGEANFKTKETV